MPDWIIWTWLGGWLICVSVGAYWAGRVGDWGVIFVGVLLGGLWPMFVAVVLVSFPFAGLYYLGKRHQ
jgi:hypothetical protein